MEEKTLPDFFRHANKTYVMTEVIESEGEANPKQENEQDVPDKYFDEN